MPDHQVKIFVLFIHLVIKATLQENQLVKMFITFTLSDDGKYSVLL
jgi:hypothetical protein